VVGSGRVGLGRLARSRGLEAHDFRSRGIAELAAGKPFETVFDEYSSAFDAKTFPHGDLGPHLETEFPIADVRLYRQLNVGEFSRTPHEDLLGWEVDKLESKRTIPAPTLAAMRPRLREYLMRAHSCGWRP